MKQLIKYITLLTSTLRPSARRLILLLAILLVGVGNAWGQAEITVTDHTGELTISGPGNYISNGKFHYDFKDASNNTLVSFELAVSGISITESTSFLYLGNGSRNGRKNASLSWDVKSGYTIKVTKVQIKTYVLTTTSATCKVGGTASSSDTKVNNPVGVDVSQSNNSGINNNVNIGYYYPNSFSIGDRQTYIYEIKISFELTHKEPLFYFTSHAIVIPNGKGSANVSPASITVQGPKGATSASCNLSFSASPNTDYVFKGWGSTSSATSYESTANPYNTSITNNTKGTTVDKTLYAILCKYKTSTTEIDFGDVAYRSSAQTRSFVIEADNVGTWSMSGLSGVFNSSFTNKSDENIQHNCTINVTVNPTTSGTFNQTLSVSTSRGGTKNVIVKAKISADPTYTWNPNIWNADGSQKKAVYVDDPNLTNIVSSTSNGAWTYSIAGTPSGVNNEGATAPTFTSNQVTCGQAGEYTLSVSQTAEVGGYNAGSSSRVLEIIKRTPTISWNSTVPYYFNETYPNTNYPSVFTLTSGDVELIDNYASTDTDVATFVGGEVTTYNVDRSTTLSVHLAENYKWNSKTFTKPIHPKKMDNHVPFTINSNDKYGTFMQSTSGNIAFESSNVIKMNNGSWTKNENAIVISFTGIPDKLKFSTSTLQDKTILIPIYPSAGDHNYYAYESSDGQVWTSVWDNPTDLSTSNNVVQLQPTTRFIKLRYHGTVYGQFVNVEVTELHKFQGEPNPIDFGKVQTDEHPVDYIYFEHANAGYRVEATSSLPAIFVVDPTVVPNTGGDKMGGEYCQVTFHPENAALNTETVGSIIFTDQLGNSTSVTVKGYATSLQVPKFTWNPLNMPYYCASTEPGAPSYYSIPNICSSSNNGPNAPELSYSSDNESAAKVVNGNLQIYVRDDASRPYPTITITVSQAACAGWESKTQKFTFTPHKKADISVPFYVTKEIFEDAYAIECPTYHHLWGDESGYEWNNGQKEFRLGSAQMTARKAPHPAFDWGNEKSVTFNFDGTPDVISFNYKLNQIGATWYQSGQDNLKPHFVVYESTDGIQWHEVGSIECRSTNYSTPARVQLSPTTAFVKLEYQGNYGGLLKDVQVTALDGYYFMKSGDKYLSRGGTNRDKAVMDDYGIAVRKTRSTNNDNSKEFTHLQYVDNEKFLCESDGVLITNSEEKRTFTATKNADGTYILKSENDTKQYLRANGNALGLTADDAQAILWKLEETDDHKASMKAIRDAQVYSATEEFGEIVSSYAKLRERLENEDYDRDTVFSYYMSGDAQEQYQGTPNNNSVVYSQLIQNNVKLVPGLYCLNVKAFYRIAPNERAYKIHDLGYDSPVAYVSLKDESNGDVANTQIGSLYEFHDNKDNYTGDDPFFKDYQVGDAYYPNCLESAKKSFARRFVYDNDAFLYVSEKANGLGEVTISIIAPSNSNDYNWLCYKDITLTRLYRKEFTFDGHDDSNWNNGQNWEYGGGRGVVPEKMHKVVIAAPAVVGNGANAGAYKITFDSQVQNNSVTVKAGGSLSVREGGFVGATHSNLVLEADGNGQTGALLLYPEMEDMPNATVQFYSTIANKKTDKEWQWQYIGTPIKNPDTNEHIFYQCWLFQHSIEDDEWTNAGNWGHMEPFRGYAFTRDNYRSSGPLFGFCGQLNDARRKELPLSYVVKNGNVHNENQIANSWTAPIRLSNLTEEDFIGVDPNIYYYQRDGQGVTSIGPFSAKYTGMDVIPAMQGFFVKTTEEKGEKQHKLVLDYKRLVWDFEKEELFRNEPLKAPSREREEQDELLSRVCINLMSADSIPDHLYLIEKEGEGFSRDFTEGYDAPKYFVDGLPCIYTYETSGPHLAVSATDDVVGTYLAINTNASQNYTLTFSKVIGEGLGLRDLVTNTIVPITEGMQYAFTAPANSSPMLRFVVVEHEETPEWNNNNGGTSLEDVGGEFKIWQSGEILSVIGAGSHASLRLYDAAGKLILSEFFNEATAINLNALPTGVYMVQVNDKTEKVLR